MKINLWPSGPILDVADRWQPLRAMPDDPPNMKAFAFKLSDGTTGLLMMHSIPPEEAMPLDQQELIDDLRSGPEVTGGQAGFIDVGVARTASGIPYVYSLMKIPIDPSGVHYNLTLHLLGDHPFQIRGHFDEGNPTGMRDAVVYELAKRRDMLRVPTADDPTGGWAHDPFDNSTSGFVMNMSELPNFDEQFPNHPLTMARELLRSISAS